jgi:hypothetical protein
LPPAPRNGHFRTLLEHVIHFATYSRNDLISVESFGHVPARSPGEGFTEMGVGDFTYLHVEKGRSFAYCLASFLVSN